MRDRRHRRGGDARHTSLVPVGHMMVEVLRRGGEIEMAEKKVTPKAATGKSGSSSAQAATRVTKRTKRTKRTKKKI